MLSKKRRVKGKRQKKSLQKVGTTVKRQYRRIETILEECAKGKAGDKKRITEGAAKESRTK